MDPTRRRYQVQTSKQLVWSLHGCFVSFTRILLCTDWLRCVPPPSQKRPVNQRRKITSIICRSCWNLMMLYIERRRSLIIAYTYSLLPMWIKVISPSFAHRLFRNTKNYRNSYISDRENNVLSGGRIAIFSVQHIIFSLRRVWLCLWGGGEGKLLVFVTLKHWTLTQADPHVTGRQRLTKRADAKFQLNGFRRFFFLIRWCLWCKIWQHTSIGKKIGWGGGGEQFGKFPDSRAHTPLGIEVYLLTPPPYTHTHTHTHTERERERERDRVILSEWYVRYDSFRVFPKIRWVKKSETTWLSYILPTASCWGECSQNVRRLAPAKDCFTSTRFWISVLGVWG